MSKRSSDDLDNDHTDELPVLLDTVSSDEGDDPPSSALLVEDTGEHTALYAVARGRGAARESELTTRAQRIAELEQEVNALAANGRQAEQHLAERDALIGHLKHTIAALRESVQDGEAAERRLAAQVAARDTRLAELATSAEQMRTEAEAREAEIEQLRNAVEEARAEPSPEPEPVARPAETMPAAEVQELREHAAALTAYIAGRQTWWAEAQATQVSLATRAAALEHELAVSARRLEESDAFALRESNRARASRAELVDYARRVDALERELRATRSAAAPPPEALPSVPTVPVLLAAAPVSASMPAAIVSTPPVSEPEQPTPATDSATAAIDDVAHLESEIEYKRQQVAAQMLELRDRDARLRALATELEHVRRELAQARTDLDRSRDVIAKLERVVIDKDRALEDRDNKIPVLHEELEQRRDKVDQQARVSSIDLSVEIAHAPALICLTGDAPKRFPLTKETVIVGRGPHCDLQIVTHFVSREHARIYLNGSAASIEDLGSRNGIFVNSVRVGRQSLQQGDLITIGETQFRFIESMAH